MATRQTRGGVIEHRIGTAGHLALSTRGGGVAVRGVDGDTVRIAAADADDGSLLDRFEVEAGDGVLRVRSPRGEANGLVLLGRHFGRGGGDELDLVVEMPRAASLELATVSGDVRVTDTVGPQRYRNVSGDLQLDRIAGSVEASTTSGSVSVQAIAPLTLRLRTVSGDLTVGAPVVHRLDVATVSGDIRVESAFEAGQEHRIETASGDTRLVATAGLTIEARTVSGDIRSDTTHRTGGGLGHREIVLGDGRARLGFRSLSGDLQIMGRGAGDLADGAAWRGSTEASEGPHQATPPGRPAAPDPQHNVRLEILRALGAGEIDVAEASDRLARLDDEVPS